jgi:hypothetical protein
MVTGNAAMMVLLGVEAQRHAGLVNKDGETLTRKISEVTIHPRRLVRLRRSTRRQPMKNFTAGLTALLLALSAQAQEPDPICKVDQPKAPPMEWRGEAAYQAKATVKNGRVVASEIRVLKGGVDRRAQRMLVQAIDHALRSAACQPGDHEFEQRFDFDLREGTPPTTR